MLTPEMVPLVTALLVALAVIGVIIAVVFPMIGGPSKAGKRLLALSATAAPSDRRGLISDESRRKQAVTITLQELEDKQRAKRNAKPTLRGRMRQAGLTWSKRTYLIVSLGVGGVAFLAVLLVSGLGAVASAALGVTLGLLLPHMYVNSLRKRRFKRFTAAFPTAVDVIVRGVKAGLPLVDCLKIVAREAQEPVRGEFKAVIEDQTMGIPIDEAVQRLPERIPLSEASFFAIVIAIQSRTGGSLSEVLGNLSKVLRERKKMDAKIKAMSSEAKASAGIIGALPVFVGVAVYLTTPAYISLLATTTTGNMVMAGCAVWMLIGVSIMRKMINFNF